MDKLNYRDIIHHSIKKGFKPLTSMRFTVTTGSPNSIAFQKAFRGATVGCTLQVFIIAFRFAYQAQVIVTEKML